MNRVGWIGFGWLAQILAEKLKNNGVDSIYFNRSIKPSAFMGFPFDLSNDGFDDQHQEAICSISHLIFTVPPSSMPNYAEKAENCLKKVHEVNPTLRILFCSSISVYGNQEGLLNEKHPLIPFSKNAVYLTEVEKQCAQLPMTSLRLGGLVGPKRHPIRTLSGKKKLNNGHHPINLIHAHEIYAFVELWMNGNIKEKRINLVNPSLMTKKDYYTKMADKYKLKAPTYLDDLSHGKKIKSLYLDHFHFQEPLDYHFE